MYDMYPYPEAVTQQGCQAQLTQLEQEAGSNGISEFGNSSTSPEQERTLAACHHERLGLQIGSRLVAQNQGDSSASV